MKENMFQPAFDNAKKPRRVHIAKPSFRSLSCQLKRLCIHCHALDAVS